MKTPTNPVSPVVDVVNELLRRFGCTAEEAEKVIKGIKIENPLRTFVDPLQED